MQPFASKVALVTGASSGLGAATARQFAREGASVVLAARRAAESEAAGQEIASLGSEAHFVRTDVSRRTDAEAMVASTLERFGRLDCAVNCAGGFVPFAPRLPRSPRSSGTSSWASI